MSTTLRRHLDQRGTQSKGSQRLDCWLQTLGATLRCDQAELRRRLVDAGYCHREDGGRRYVRNTRSLGEGGAALHALAQALPDLIREHRQARQAEGAAPSTRDLGG